MLKEILKYEPNTGNFIWISGRANGKVAGSINNYGYIHIRINKKLYKAHRLAWLYVYGSMENCFIDHIDGDKSNNRIENLRLATNIQNQQNQRSLHSNNKSGFIGVSKIGNKWRAQIRIYGKVVHLGSFSCPSIASERYLSVKRDVHSHCTI